MSATVPEYTRNPDDLIDLKGLCALLHITRRTYYNAKSEGRDLPTPIKPFNTLLFYRPEVDAWLALQRKPTAGTVLRERAAAHAVA